MEKNNALFSWELMLPTLDGLSHRLIYSPDIGIYTNKNTWIISTMKGSWRKFWSVSDGIKQKIKNKIQRNE